MNVLIVLCVNLNALPMPFFSEDEVPSGQEEFLKINEELSAVWPNITEKKDALPDYEKWDGVEGKLQYLER